MLCRLWQIPVNCLLAPLSKKQGHFTDINLKYSDDLGLGLNPAYLTYRISPVSICNINKITIPLNLPLYNTFQLELVASDYYVTTRIRMFRIGGTPPVDL